MLYIIYLLILIKGYIIVNYIRKSYSKHPKRNLISSIVVIIVIATCMSIHFNTLTNIGAFLYGTMECIFTYKYNKKENVQLLLEGYIVAFIAFLFGIILTVKNYIE